MSLYAAPWYVLGRGWNKSPDLIDHLPGNVPDRPATSQPNESHILFRFGAAYLFSIGRLSAGPEFDVDIVEVHPTFVAGLSVGIGF